MHFRAASAFIDFEFYGRARVMFAIYAHTFFVVAAVALRPSRRARAREQL